MANVAHVRTTNKFRVHIKMTAYYGKTNNEVSKYITKSKVYLSFT